MSASVIGRMRHATCLYKGSRVFPEQTFQTIKWGLCVRTGYRGSDRRNSRQISEHSRQGTGESSLDRISQCWVQHRLHTEFHRRSGVFKPQRRAYWTRSRVLEEYCRYGILVYRILFSFLLDDDNCDEGFTVLHSGRHEFPFSLELPQTPLATSFEGKHGSVRYWVKAELHRPWLLPMKTKKEFTVFEHIDINTPLLLSPQAGTKDKTLCCWFCTSGPVSLSAKIERKGYTPGESIQIFAEIENCSSRVVVPKAAIYQTQTFFAKGKVKEIKQLVANLRGDPLPSGKTETWDGKMLKIPPISPSILDCTIIHVEYSLMVYVDIPRAVNLTLNLPLVIGTIPLHSFGSRTSSVSSQCSMSWLGLPERPEAPPSYSEIVTDEQRQNNLELPAVRDEIEGPLYAYIHEFRFQPPPLYSEVDPNPDQVCGSMDRRPDTCPSR